MTSFETEHRRIILLVDMRNRRVLSCGYRAGSLRMSLQRAVTQNATVTETNEEAIYGPLSMAKYCGTGGGFFFVFIFYFLPLIMHYNAAVEQISKVPTGVGND